MSTIPLRAYNREIEEALEQKQFEEAIAHCRHILKVFPKHIDTYRLLGKAYLESQRYGNAADIFQRILSSIPDDFVSHVGMSIIREDEGNLDAAIWHMERSFEIQPYNTAIQGELRRLYGQRDGMEPPKIRMTRGALARMYAKSDLYDQAISEINSNLVEDPQRADLEVLLAQMYAKNGQQTEAIQVYSSLLKRLPNCIEANRYLSQVFSESDRADDLKTHHQRLESLNPYEAHISAKMPTANDVPDQAVMLNQLDWDGGTMIAEDSEQPEWATSIGIKLDEGEMEDEELPDWLRDSTEESPESYDPTKETRQSIPSWMQEAGWGPSQGEYDESKSSLDFDEEPSSRDHAVVGEIPGWLQDIAPEEMRPEDQAFSMDAETSDIDLPSWLAGEADGASDTIINWLDDRAKETPQNDIDEEISASWDHDDASPETEPAADIPQTGEIFEGTEIPDWVQDFEGESQAPSPEKLPDWLSDLEASAVEKEDLADTTLSDHRESATTDETEEIPVWLAGSIEELAIPAQDDMDTTTDESESLSLPSWLQNFEGEGQEIIPAIQTPDVVETSSGDIEALSVPEPADIPDWLREMEEKAKEPIMSAAEAGEEIAEPEIGEMPDWLLKMEAETSEPEIGDEIVTENLIDEESTFTLDQLRKIDEEIEPEMMETVSLEDLSDEEPVEIPEWLRDIGEETPTSEPIEQPSRAEVEPSGIFEADKLDEALLEFEPDALPDWLGGLAEQKISDEIQAPEEPPETFDEIEPASLPDWLQDITKGEPDSTIPSGVTGWLKNIDEDELNEMVIEYEPGELPEWLENLVKERGETKELAHPEMIAPEEDINRIDIPAFKGLPEITQEMLTDQPESISDAKIELPDWLTDLDEAIESETVISQETEADFKPPTEEETIVGEQVPFSDIKDADAAMAWLEGLAAKQGISEEELLTRPEDRLESPPEWVQEEIDSAAKITTDIKMSEAVIETEIVELEQPIDLPEAETIETVAEAAVELPDWIENVEEIEGLEEERLETAPEMVTEAELVPLEESQPVIDFEDAEAAMAWLEGLAAKQGVSEEELLTRPEDRPEEPPEWVQAEIAGETSREVPDWLQETLNGETLFDETVLQTPEDIQEEIPDWLKAIYQSESVLQDEEISQEPEEISLANSEYQTEGLESIPDFEHETIAVEAIQTDHPLDQRDSPVSAEVIPDIFSEADQLAIEAEITTPEITDFIPEPEVLESTEEAVSEFFEATSEETHLEPAVDEGTIEPAGEVEIEPPAWVLSGEEPAEEEYQWLPTEIEGASSEADSALDLNEASMIQLERLSPLGFRKAQAIVAYRNENGPFEDISDLLLIPGIDQEIIDQLGSRLMVKQHKTAEIPSEIGIEPPVIPEDDPHAMQLAAQAHIRRGDIETAIEKYELLIKQGQRLDEVMEDLGQAIADGHISEKLVETLTNLGDAFLKNNQLQAALDAYTKAEKLLG